MAKINLGLKHSDVDTSQREGTGGALPDGYYRFEVDELQPKDHHDKRPGYKLDAVLEVIEPEEFKGRKIFLDFGVDDPKNEEWEQWGREALGRFLKAIDFPEDKEFDDTDDAIGRTGIAKVGLDRKRSDKQNKRFSKLWAYVYPEDERDFFDKNELGAAERQEEWFPGKQSEAGSRGRSDDRGSRGGDRGGREERGGREDRGSRDRSGREESRGRDERGGGRDREDSDRSRSRDRDDGGRGRDSREESRGGSDDDIPFNEGDAERPARGGGDNPWNRGGGRR